MKFKPKKLYTRMRDDTKKSRQYNFKRAYAQYQLSIHIVTFDL